MIFLVIPLVDGHTLVSERYRLTSTDSINNNEFLYVEDLVSPGTVVRTGLAGTVYCRDDFIVLIVIHTVLVLAHV